MIEDCSDLPQCETRLSKEVQKVDLLGQVPLSCEDLDHLGTLIRQRVSSNISAGTHFLEQAAPTCLACFLVWMGIVGYRDGDYWSAVHESSGLVEDPNWEGKWGRLFLDFLDAHKNLPRFDIKGGHTYVAPILTHGGIPNSCLDEYFEKVLLPLVQRDLIDPTDPHEIIHELALYRENARDRVEVAQQCSDLRKQVRSLARQARQAQYAVEAYSVIISLWQAEAIARALSLPPQLPTDYGAFEQQQREEIHRLQKAICDLEERQGHCEQVSARFTERDKKVLIQAEAIERDMAAYPVLDKQQRRIDTLATEEEASTGRLSDQAAGILSAPWNDNYGELIAQLPFDALQEEITRFQSIVARQEHLEQTRDRPRASSIVILSPARGVFGVFVPLLLGLILVVLGLYIVPSWALSIAGVGCIAIAGFAGWLWCGERKKRIQIEVLEHTLNETRSERERVESGIAKILGDLPIAERQLRSPSLELHEALVSLAGTYRELEGIRSHREQLEEKIRRQIQHIEQTASSIDVQPMDGLDNAIGTLKQALETAQAREAAAARALKELDHIQPKLLTSTARLQTIRQNLAQTEEQLSKLGGGDIQKGVRQVEEQRQQQARATKLRAKLEEEYPNLATIEHQIQSAQKSGKDKNALEVRARQLAEQLEIAQTQADRAQQELSYYPAAFPGVDEPIRRYLLYGGKPAGAFLVKSVALAYQSLTGEVVPTADDAGLPGRVVTAFGKWWMQHSDELERRIPPDEQETSTGQRFRTPAISIDSAMAEIIVHFYPQRYPASTGGTGAHLEVTEPSPNSRRQIFPLRVYRRTENLLETQELEFPLPFPADRYEFSLRCDGGLINQWEVPAMHSDAPFMAFEGRSGKLIKDKEQLPRGKVWLVSKDASLKPVECILEKGSLYEQWKDYSFLKLNLEDVDELRVTDEQGQHFRIPISSEKVSTLDLVGGQRLQGVYSDGVEVYVGPAPRIHIPINDEAELRLWQISIFSDEDSNLGEPKHYRLSELQETSSVQIDEGWVDVPLADGLLLGRRPVGRFTICVRKRPYLDWRSTVCIVPDLGVTFENDVYLPYETEKAPEIHVRVSTAKATEFIPQSPARLCDTEDGFCSMAISGDEDALRGTLRISSLDGKDLQIPLTVSIPKLRWRLQGLEGDRHAAWSDRVEEVWLGETVPELFLVVALPSFVGERLRLSVGDGSPMERETILREGKARFDLSAFEDALRVGPSVQTFTLTIPGSRLGIEHVPLFMVRTHWEVEDVKWSQESEGQIVILNVSWTEKGKTGDRERIARLWGTSGTLSSPIVEQRVPQGTHVTLRATVGDLPPGRYLLQLTLEDPWSATEVSPPARDARNLRVIEIVRPLPSDFHPQAWGKKERAIACVHLTPTKGGFLVNGEPLERYFSGDQPSCFTRFGRIQRQDIALAPFVELDLDPGEFAVTAYVEGCNPEEGKRQPRAIAHAVAGALSLLDESWRHPLVRAGFRLQFDPPEWVERDHPRLLALRKSSESGGNRSMNARER